MLPPELATLLAAKDPAAREAAWTTFVAMHSRLLLHTASSLHRDHDAAMDAYAHLLDVLRQDDFRRLRAYSVDERSRFTSWLAVVARHLCVDQVRQRYGRAQDSGPRAELQQETRRRLVDHLAEAIEMDDLADPTTGDAEARLRAAQLIEALMAALAALAPRDRLLLKLRFVDDLSAREIALIVKAPTPFHTYRRLKALLAELREALSRRGIQESEP